MQRIDLPDADAANTQILDDLNNAASGAVLVFEGAVGDYGYALPATEAAIEAALNGVHLDWGVPIELDFGPPSRQAAGHRRQLCQGEGARARPRSTSASASIRSAPWRRVAWRPSPGPSLRPR